MADDKADPKDWKRQAATAAEDLGVPQNELAQEVKRRLLERTAQKIVDAVLPEGKYGTWGRRQNPKP